MLLKRPRIRPIVFVAWRPLHFMNGCGVAMNGCGLANEPSGKVNERLIFPQQCTEFNPALFHSSRFQSSRTCGHYERAKFMR
jgi:hypothetical protein